MHIRVTYQFKIGGGGERYRKWFSAAGSRGNERHQRNVSCSRRFRNIDFITDTSLRFQQISEAYRGPPEYFASCKRRTKTKFTRTIMPPSGRSQAAANRPTSAPGQNSVGITGLSAEASRAAPQLRRQKGSQPYAGANVEINQVTLYLLASAMVRAIPAW